MSSRVTVAYLAKSCCFFCIISSPQSSLHIIRLPTKWFYNVSYSAGKNFVVATSRCTALALDGVVANFGFEPRVGLLYLRSRESGIPQITLILIPEKIADSSPRTISSLNLVSKRFNSAAREFLDRHLVLQFEVTPTEKANASPRAIISLSHIKRSYRLARELFGHHHGFKHEYGAHVHYTLQNASFVNAGHPKLEPFNQRVT